VKITISESDQPKVELMRSLGDAVLLNQWSSEEKIPKMTSYWVQLAELADDEGQSDFLTVIEVLSQVLFSFANHYYDEFCEQWEEIFDRASRICSILQLEYSRIDICDFVVGISRDHILNFASNESVTLFFDGWEHLVWKRSKRSRVLDEEAAKAAIVAHMTLFGSMVLELAEEDREEMREFIFDIALQQYGTVELSDVVDLEVLEFKTPEETPEPPSASDSKPLSETKITVLDGDSSADAFYEELIAHRTFANRINHGNSKPRYCGEDADYLMKALALALTKEPKPADMTPQEWAKSRPDQVVILDAHKVVLNPKPTLKNAPQSAIKGRLMTIFSSFSAVQFIDVIRAKKMVDISFTGELIEPGYAVVLHKSVDPIPRYHTKKPNSHR
jgi:hypothetical protein